jgi:hypothetical protein
MGDNETDLLLSGLFENDGKIAVLGDVILALVDIDESRQTLIGGWRRPSVRVALKM